MYLGEHCYNTTYHISIGMTPFKALYGYDAPYFIDRIFGDSKAPLAKDWIQESQEILRALKENIQVAQNLLKMYADQHRTERNFELADLVFLRFHPYRYSMFKKNGAEKLKSRFYGPYKILRRLDEVVYELELPSDSRIRNVFHVSCLKKAIGQ